VVQEIHFGTKWRFDVDIDDTVDTGLQDPKLLWGREPRQWSWPVRLSGQDRRGMVRAEGSSLLRRGCQMSQILYWISLVHFFGS
jgi:hypothetical protein